MIILATHKLYIVTNAVLKWVALFRHYKRPILVHFWALPLTRTEIPVKNRSDSEQGRLKTC